jgi:hypothetical protein
VTVFKGFGVSDCAEGSNDGEVGIGGIGSALGAAWRRWGQGEGEGRTRQTAKAKGVRIGVREGAWVKGVAAATVVSRGHGSVLARSSGKGGRGVAWVAKGKAKTLTVKHRRWQVAVRVSTQRKRGQRKHRREKKKRGSWWLERENPIRKVHWAQRGLGPRLRGLRHVVGATA